MAFNLDVWDVVAAVVPTAIYESGGRDDRRYLESNHQRTLVLQEGQRARRDDRGLNTALLPLVPPVECLMNRRARTSTKEKRRDNRHEQPVWSSQNLTAHAP